MSGIYTITVLIEPTEWMLPEVLWTKYSYKMGTCHLTLGMQNSHIA